MSKKDHFFFYFNRIFVLLACLAFFLGFVFPVLASDENGTLYSLSAIFRGEAGEPVLLFFVFFLLFFFVTTFLTLYSLISRNSLERILTFTYSIDSIALGIFASKGTPYYIGILGLTLLSYLLFTVTLFAQENRGKKLFSGFVLFATLLLFLFAFFLGRANLTIGTLWVFPLFPSICFLSPFSL